MKIAIDIDGTICEERGTFERCLAQPIPKSREVVNQLHEEGHTIIFFTARGWAEYNATVEWLNRHGFKYDMLICGKVHYDIFIDDRSELPNWNYIEQTYIN